MAEKKKFYLTTAIAYTSGKPHIGNTYEAVLADSIVRFKRQQGYDVRFRQVQMSMGRKSRLNHRRQVLHLNSLWMMYQGRLKAYGI